jgi:plasmid stability protein
MTPTTLALDDDLLRQLKARAAQEGSTLQTLTNELLRHALALAAADSDYRLEIEPWEARTQAGVDLLDRDKLFDLMDGR